MSLSAETTTGILRAQADAVPYSAKQTWIALLDPEGNELTADDYARQRVRPSDDASPPRWSAPLVGSTEGRVENVEEVVFTESAQEAWGNIAEVVVFDDESASTNEVMRQAIPVQTVNRGGRFRLGARAIKIVLRRQI